MKVDWDEGSVSAEWDRPAGDARAALILGHGAGGDLNDPLLREVASVLASRGIAVLRFNFPYREAGRRSPGSQRQSEACYRAVGAAAREEGVPLYCGGKSYGGRMATHVAADGFELDGLVLISYPLHPPGKPENVRDAHLSKIAAPMLFVQGSRDPFATPELLERTVASLRNATFVGIEGGDHSLRVSGTKSTEVAKRVSDAIDRFVGPG